MPFNFDIRRLRKERSGEENLYITTIYHHVKGGRFFTPENFENIISSYEFEVMTRTCTNIFGEVFGPCAHCCPSEALEQKKTQKTQALTMS